LAIVICVLFGSIVLELKSEHVRRGIQFGNDLTISEWLDHAGS
jgi:hypothetical protein